MAESRACAICGNSEPFHVHNQGERIEDYFLVGRGLDEMGAARIWKVRAVGAEAGVERLQEALQRIASFPVNVPSIHCVEIAMRALGMDASANALGVSGGGHRR